MRKPTEEERRKLEQRRALFRAFLDEIPEVLVEFCATIGCGQPHQVLGDPGLFVEAVDRFVSKVDFENIERHGRTWLLARLTCFIGEVVLDRFDGEWLLDEDPESSTYLVHVVGQFSDYPNVQVDPAAAASGLISQPPGRSLIALLEDLDNYIQLMSRPTLH